jgi:hypothetical protein
MTVALRKDALQAHRTTAVEGLGPTSQRCQLLEVPPEGGTFGEVSWDWSRERETSENITEIIKNVTLRKP